MAKKRYDVVIIGAGPAGMFAAYELVKNEFNGSILLIDEGKDIENRKCPMEETGVCVNCVPCDIMCGVGGTGTYSDGTLNLRPDIGGSLSDYTSNQKEALDLVGRVDKIFLEFGCPDKLYGVNEEAIHNLKKKAASVGVSFVDIPQRHIGTDESPNVIARFRDYLVGAGVEFLLETRVADLLIEDGTCKGVVLGCGRKINGRYVLAAPGRYGASWFNSLVQRHDINAKFSGIDVGVRVEVPAIVLDDIIEINRDPKFHIRSERYDDFVRTFCTNHRGFVVKENYDGVVGVNGHSFIKKDSENTNFAFLVRVELTEPLEDTIEYGMSIAKLSTTIGGGKPILQRLGDLRRGRRSHNGRIESNRIQPTFTDVTPGDISMALPHRIVMDLLEGLKKLNEIIPGVYSDSTLLYAPEIKFYATQVSVDGRMQSSLRGLFVAGDGAGLSRDIINAAATGLLAARGILTKDEG
ncbi:MAG: NAD(P)/FAD-dependent oxidoreductase [Candidatus Altiarchaeota archaeon]|nr:NAD(P)/FAD-dependent oxidoreductase [Candidatus Altiarchaeota archaeon]